MSNFVFEPFSEKHPRINCILQGNDLLSIECLSFSSCFGYSFRIYRILFRSFLIILFMELGILASSLLRNTCRINHVIRKEFPLNTSLLMIWLLSYYFFKTSLIHFTSRRSDFIFLKKILSFRDIFRLPTCTECSNQY